MNLPDLLRCTRIAIQCHDNPDADAIAAGFGLYSYFAAKGAEAVLFYGGKNPVAKPNLLKMLELCSIPLRHCPENTEWPGLLLTVDCQHGAGNVSPMRGKEVAVIDHHIQECPPPPMHDIRPYLGSCATLVWTLMRDAGFHLEDLEPEQRSALATALHYGLFMDTGGFAEVRHPLDRDLRDVAGVNERIVKTLKNSNLSLEDLSVASSALAQLHFDPAEHFALAGARPCDPNILGVISDLALQVDAVDTVVAYTESPEGMKYSVRSLTREYKASDIAVWLAAGGLGSGGGHAEKAGGWISARNFAERMPGMSAAGYFHRRLAEYKAAYAFVDGAESALPPDDAAARSRRYVKRPLRLAYVPAEALPRASTLHIRMLEGDITLACGPDTHLMIGLQGEVYPIARAAFDAAYTPLNEPLLLDVPYAPTVLDTLAGVRLPLADIARPCLRREGSAVRAAPLERGMKLFTRWDADNYIKGEKGDWLVWPEDDPRDMYIITAALFPVLYAEDGAGLPRDCTDMRVAAQPGAVRARKKPVRVNVRFAREQGLAATREGTVPYEANDALVSDGRGCTWPVRPERFCRAYAPVPPLRPGQDGLYQAHPLESAALRMAFPFCVTLKNGAVLRGEGGDWLLQYGAGDYGIVGADQFAAAYEIIEPA